MLIQLQYLCAKTENKMSGGIMASVLVCNWSGPASACGLGEAKSDLSFADAIAVARGCLDYGGGYRSDEGKLDIFHHGIQTVINALEGARKTNLTDLQSRTLHAMGSASDTQPSQPASEPAKPLTTLEGQPAGFYLCKATGTSGDVGQWDGKRLKTLLGWDMTGYTDFTRLYDAAEVEEIESVWQARVEQFMSWWTREKDKLATVTAERDALAMEVERMTGERDALRQQLRDRQLADHPPQPDRDELRKYAESLKKDHGRIWAPLARDWLRLDAENSTLKALLRDVPLLRDIELHATYSTQGHTSSEWLARRRAALNIPLTEPKGTTI